MNPARCHAGIHKFYQPFQRSLLVKGGDCTSAFYSVKLCVMINFSLRHNVHALFSFVVVFYSMYSLYAIIKVVLLNERDCHV